LRLRRCPMAEAFDEPLSVISRDELADESPHLLVKSYSSWKTRRGYTLAWCPHPRSPVDAGARGGIPRAHENTGIGADEPKLDELLTQGVADCDACTELLKLAVRKIVEEALEAEVAEAVG
jgi:hypothetical protein